MYKKTDILKTVQANNQITLQFLLDFSDIKKDRFDDIMERVLFSFGIDFQDENSKIDFDMYVRLKCFVKYYTIDKEELMKVWLKILNPNSNLSLPKSELEDLFERFARGKIQPEKILVSETFSLNMIELLVTEGCQDPDNKDNILMSSLKDRLEDGTIEIELFN